MAEAASDKQEKIMSTEKKKMVGEDSLRTLDCLRGRLLAERQASRVAKDEAEFLGNKLVEIEKKLKEEIKLRQKAEKKLKFLIKKLESLKISPTLLDQSASSSENSGFSSSSSTKETEESESITSQILLQMEENSTTTPDSKEYSQSFSNSEEPRIEVGRRKESGDDEEYSVDDESLALVPATVTLAEPSIAKTSELKIINKGINEVLDGLRHARREKMEIKRSIISVGPLF